MGERRQREDGAAACRLVLLGNFELRVGADRVELPRATERVLAYLALQPSPVSRLRVAAALWPDSTERRSLGCLRSALWRVRSVSRSLLEPDHACLGIAPGTEVDVARLGLLARQLVDAGPPLDGTAAPPLDGTAAPPLDGTAAPPLDVFGSELLPGWDEEWVLLERERLRQLSLCGLDALSRRHLEAGRVLDALDAAWRAIALEPLRESAHHTLIDAYLADGNVGEAVRGLRSFEALLHREIGIAPSPDLVRRVRSAVADRQTAGALQ